MKLRDAGSLGACRTAGGVLHGESLGEAVMVVIAGLLSSSSTEAAVAEASCMQTLSDCCVGLCSDRASSERTSLTGEKQREMFPASRWLWGA